MWKVKWHQRQSASGESLLTGSEHAKAEMSNREQLKAGLDENGHRVVVSTE